MARILVVGSKAWCAQTCASLQAVGHEVESFHDALDAVELALRSPVATIVTESTLTGASGLQLCRLLHAELPLGGIPVVVMSAELGVAFEARAAGATAQVRDVDGLLEVLPGILARPPLAVLPVRADRSGLERRLSFVLDRALRDSEIAADVRALANVGGLVGMFEGLVELASQVLPYSWLGLVVSGENGAFLLHAPYDDEAAERQAREVLAVDDGAPCIGAGSAAAGTRHEDRISYEPFEVPIFFGDALVGQLAVALPVTDEGDLKRAVSLVAYELGGPLKIVSLLEQVQRQAATDALTGLMNRRAFLDLVAREQARSARYRGPISFLVVDIDHFKRVNDVHGHAAGDAVLRGVARAFDRATRATDLVCRWGGEEFVLALPQTELDDAIAVAERIRALLEETSHELPDGGLLAVTASIGVSTATGPWGIEEIIAAADVHLYEAKRAGRNRVHAPEAECRLERAS